MNVGDRFGRLVIIEESSPHITPGLNYYKMYKCRCDCGVVKDIAESSLANGRTKSCGCLRIEEARKRFFKNGISTHPLYRMWNNFKSQCYNTGRKSHRQYKMYEEWVDNIDSFITWAESNGWKPGKKIRRKSTGDYFPNNMRVI